jgi:hypothetical protein
MNLILPCSVLAAASPPSVTILIAAAAIAIGFALRHRDH